MADVTVKELAESVGTPVDRLLGQMTDAGLPHEREDDVVFDEQKTVLLSFLKKSHGDVSSEPRKITLQRKMTTQLRAPSSGGRSKTVNIEVRKKRTYVKRDALAESTTTNKTEADSALSAKRLQEQQQLEAAQARAVEEKQADEQRLAAEQAVEVAGKAQAASDQQQTVETQAQPSALDNAEAAQPLSGLEDDSAEKRKATKAKAKPRKETEEGEAASRGGEKHSSKKNKGAKESTMRHKGTRHQQMIELVDESDDEYQPRARRSRKGRREHQFERPTAPVIRDVELGQAITVADLASQMSVKSMEVVKVLFKLGMVANVNQVLDQDTAVLAVEEMGHRYRLINENELEDSIMDIGYEGEQHSRAPVVTVMGHVDHGKTSLLDRIRATKVVSGEAGGITQHIGADHVTLPKGGMITFLDTPGHAAFTAMRARGAKATDIVILVVAADDGVMPQTEEAIQHAKAAGVPIVVAINKCDKESADIDRVTSELSARDVVPESWGGDTQFIAVSAHTGQGLDELLEAVVLQAELLELKAYHQGLAKGVVVESSVDKGRRPIATLLVQQGQLALGDIVIAGSCWGRVRALLDEEGQAIQTAGPSIPVEILGLDDAPDAGSEFVVVTTERRARELANERMHRARVHELAQQRTAKLESLFANIGQSGNAVLNVVLKTDVRGSLEALSSALLQLSTDEVQVNIIVSGVGSISESDVNLALASGAVIFGFNVRASGKARSMIEKAGIDLRYYSVIYDIVNDVKDALSGMLRPELREEIVGVAQVRDIFNSPKFGLIAGSMVIEGTVYRHKNIRVLRDDVVIYEGELESLRRFKDDVAEVRNGMECGIGVKNYTDVKVGDKIEVFDVKEIARRIE